MPCSGTESVISESGILKELIRDVCMTDMENGTTYLIYRSHKQRQCDSGDIFQLPAELAIQFKNVKNFLDVPVSFVLSYTLHYCGEIGSFLSSVFYKNL